MRTKMLCKSILLEDNGRWVTDLINEPGNMLEDNGR